jgi:hypothetical protein
LVSSPPLAKAAAKTVKLPWAAPVGSLMLTLSA